MSHGFSLKNLAGESIISSLTYNVVYRGRATYFHYYYYVPAMPAEAHGAGGFTAPYVAEFGFYFDAPDDSPIIPFFRCVGYCAISFFRRHASIPRRWEIYFFAEYQPDVYCFSKLSPSTPVDGSGIAVWSELGGLSYLSTQPHLIPRSVTPALAPACNPFNYNYGGNYQHKEPNQAVFYTPTSHSGGIGVPLLHFSAGNSGAANSQDNYAQYFFVRLARFEGPSISVRWGTSLAAAWYSNFISHNEPQSEIIAILADGTGLT